MQDLFIFWDDIKQGSFIKLTVIKGTHIETVNKTANETVSSR